MDREVLKTRDIASALLEVADHLSQEDEVKGSAIVGDERHLGVSLQDLHDPEIEVGTSVEPAALGPTLGPTEPSQLSVADARDLRDPSRDR